MVLKYIICLENMLNKNKIIREVVQSKFDDAYPLEAYVDTFDGYGDNPTILSKFGIEANK